jgi:hypothetical protein
MRGAPEVDIPQLPSGSCEISRLEFRVGEGRTTFLSNRPAVCVSALTQPVRSRVIASDSASARQRWGKFERESSSWRECWRSLSHPKYRFVFSSEVCSAKNVTCSEVMPVSRTTKVATGLIAVAVLGAAGIFAHGFYRAWHKFSVEDDIHGAFFPMVRALDDYERDHGAPATNLTQLIPRYIPQIPRSRFVDSVRYDVLEDGKAWQLRLHSRALEPPRLYCCRSDNKYTAEEEKRILLRYHAVWVVLRD